MTTTRTTMRQNVVVWHLLQQRVWVMFTVTLVFAVSWVPGFLSGATLSLALDQSVALGIVALGLTLCLIVGQIDLSSGSVVALSGITAIGLQSQLGLIGASVAAILVGVACGALNATIVGALKVNSLVATLAVDMFIRSMCQALTDSKPISSEDPLFGSFLTQGLFGTWTTRSFLFLLGILVLQVLLLKTVWGRSLMAVGSNSEAAFGAGIPSRTYTSAAFVTAGACSGVAGVLISLSVASASPVTGQTIALSALTAVVIGGTRLEGGRGSAIGTLGGVLVIAMLATTMSYQSVPSYVQDIVIGSILIFLVVLDRMTPERVLHAQSSLSPDRPSDARPPEAPQRARQLRPAEYEGER